MLLNYNDVREIQNFNENRKPIRISLVFFPSSRLMRESSRRPFGVKNAHWVLLLPTFVQV